MRLRWYPHQNDEIPHLLEQVENRKHQDSTGVMQRDRLCIFRSISLSFLVRTNVHNNLAQVQTRITNQPQLVPIENKEVSSNEGTKSIDGKMARL
jgi:hypothetical protein